MEAIVVGTGPSGVAAIAKLLECGIRPLVLDAGIVSKRAGIANVAPSAPRTEGMKTWFGSDEALQQVKLDVPVDFAGAVTARPSYGFGGLSRIWGATFDFYDFSSWPSESRPSQEDVEFIRDLVPHSRTVWSGIQAGENRVLGNSRAGQLFKSMSDSLRSQGWESKESVVAIDTKKDSTRSCCGSARCLTGCPRDAIWFAGNLIQNWIATDAIDYRPGYIVERLESSFRQVKVIGSHFGEGVITTARTVFLACGPISTGIILINSGFYDQLIVRDSATFFGGVVKFERPNTADDRQGHQLSQWWLLAANKRASMQVYGPSHEHLDRLRDRVNLPDQMLKQILDYIYPVIGYLSQDDSESIVMNSFRSTVRLESSGSRHVLGKFDQSIRDLRRLFLRHGVVVSPRLFRYSGVGGGYHSGSSLPMGVLSDRLGRPRSHSDQIHVVDSSVLPRIEVGSITPTIMANAVRIVNEALKL